MIRIDGRKPNDIRPVKITKNFINTASSSFQISIGCTTVMIAIFNKVNPEKNKNL
jgi:exosome complex RNA-binding protein Rrp42 (RNase PH superfamily)